MKAEQAVPANVDEYIAQFPPDVQKKLQRLRAAIKEAAPDAKEKISYRMPAYSQDGDLAFFAAFKSHIGFYPLPEALGDFSERLAPYAQGKGSVQFPLDEEPPLALVKDIVRYRLAANRRKAEAKKDAKGKRE
jgi:uncharacterized protein YdhG (YjbR/CyaY superfamily)